MTAMDTLRLLLVKLLNWVCDKRMERSDGDQAPMAISALLPANSFCERESESLRPLRVAPMPLLDNASFLRALKKMLEDARSGTGSVYVTFKSGSSACLRSLWA